MKLEIDHSRGEKKLRFGAENAIITLVAAYSTFIHLGQLVQVCDPCV